MWPDNVVGSITHTSDFAACCVSSQSEALSIGLDAEKVAYIRLQTALLYASTEELTETASVDFARQRTAIFSIKEAISKAAVEIPTMPSMRLSIDWRRGSFTADVGSQQGLYRGSFLFHENLVLSFATASSATPEY